MSVALLETSTAFAAKLVARGWSVGCKTVADLRDLDPRLARNSLTVVG